jgi:hypothetical protein
MSCALTGTGGTCSTVPAGQDPLNQCTIRARPAAAPTDLRRQRRLPQLRQRHALRRRGLQRGQLHARAHLQRYRDLPDDVGDLVRRVQLGIRRHTCLTTCSTERDCIAPNICNAGQCTKKPLGTTCTGGTECASGLCQQGVCCSSSCTGTCRSCALSGTAGTARSSRRRRPAEPVHGQRRPTCGTDGTCDGAGGCRSTRRHAVRGGELHRVDLLAARTCNGTGTCQTTSLSTCNPYVCGTAARAGRPAPPRRLHQPNTCISGSCGKKPIGATCGAAAECDSTFCEQGVCCATACVGICRSCGLTGTVGTCASVAAGADPFNQCTDRAPTCGNDGTCDGSGACRRTRSARPARRRRAAERRSRRAHLHGSRDVRHATATSCGAYKLRRRRDVPGDVHG